MDGFKNIAVRLLGFESGLLPLAALASYAVLFFLLAVWQFRRVSEWGRRAAPSARKVGAEAGA